MKNINSDVISRIVMALLLLYVPFTFATSYDSVAAQMGRLQPQQGLFLIVAMSFIAALIFFDVLLNSIMKFRWKWATRHRDAIYLLGSFCSVTVLFSVVKYTDLQPGAIYLYVVLFFFCAIMGIIDSHNKRPMSEPKVERRRYVR